MKAHIIGAGLAGSECAWQLAMRGHQVVIHEMRPKKLTKAHHTGLCAELVCSNSFRGAALTNAVGLLKEELKLLDSLIMQAAIESEVPAGGCLAVDRDLFSKYVDDSLRNHPLVEFVEEEIISLDGFSTEMPLIIASGPLTSPELAKQIEIISGSARFSFYDAISPILYGESLDMNKVFRQSRYDKGSGSDYLNIPLNQDQYLEFISAVNNAATYSGNQSVENEELTDLKPFEGCMPIEDIIERGPDTLRFGPFKPKGLTDPATGKQPYAVLQLRQDNKEGTLWSMVGMQTRMKRADQQRIFTALPGLENAEFARYGSVHRNSFLNSPDCLSATLELREKHNIFFAGQVTGVEGYVESTAGGLIAGINASRRLENKELMMAPIDTAIGALLTYISDSERKDFQPMNITFGLMPSYFEMAPQKKLTKKDRRTKTSEQALKSIEAFKDQATKN